MKMGFISLVLIAGIFLPSLAQADAKGQAFFCNQFQRVATDGANASIKNETLMENLGEEAESVLTRMQEQKIVFTNAKYRDEIMFTLGALWVAGYQTEYASGNQKSPRVIGAELASGAGC